MIESHEKRRKAEIGADGTARGRFAASIDASGAVLGCVGLALFALIVWKTLPYGNAYGVIATAFLGWAALSIFSGQSVNIKVGGVWIFYQVEDGRRVREAISKDSSESVISS